MTIDCFKRTSFQEVGPGGVKCPCCATRDRKRARRRARRRMKADFYRLFSTGNE